MDPYLYRPWRKAFTGPRFARFASFTILAALLLSACAPAATPAPSPTALPPSPTTASTATSVPTQTALPSPTATFIPSPTLEPTPTQTATPLPAILQDGFNAWCVPGDSPNLGVVTSKMPSDAGHYTQVKDAVQLTVPIGSCTFVFTFNQPVPAAAQFQIYDGLDHLAYTITLTSLEGQPNVGLVTLINKLMLDPPYYSITFRMAVFTPANGQMWTSKVVFARPIPAACFEANSGILPDPVTGACPAADPREPEYCRKAGSLSCHHKGVQTEN
ncbi:MAG: hypothetical protein ABSE06_03045 [Anaerolineaceae bacterium]